ncbi:FAD-dependent oxidoreductase [Dactylosporangium matsuzakiense]|uniref:Hydroxylase n=1 Tax=Dactylosporangium matsuzakiense TaxID=53360 RepID=A0A9W6NIZ4_9ACTN|nr:FAD-dependent oxidoreductase [Dactylosporangium matsuzakiense]UWZ47059.1 FAD-dependent oxidoreductase [Dactylosporangium matsuzakiense]GLK98510.1 hydroxylase [Dactylosporangium matsuzakiense]
MAPSAPQVFAEISTSAPPGPPRRIIERAVVLGGSMAGLMAARVLSDHAGEVVIVERDPTEGAEPRPGVPQGTQVHALLPAGQTQLERWFPGFTDAAVAAGAPDYGRSDGRVYINNKLREVPDPPPQRPILITTRPFLEYQVRRRVLALPNVRVVCGRAEGLRFTGSAVTGAAYAPAGQDEPVLLDADLVVDAMGRSSRLNDWLEEHGWPRAPMRRMPIRLNYASALFERDESISDTWVVVTQETPGPGRVARIGGVLSVEQNRWLMLVAGYDDDRPSRDPAEYAERCRRYFPAMFGEIAEKGRMIGGIITYHQADSRRRDFHAVDRLPAGLVAAGDAVASFNPVYGQGMTSAMLHASSLSAWLQTGPDVTTTPAREYFEKVRVVVDAAWQISTFADLGLPHVTSGQPRGYRIIRWAGDLVQRASMVDEPTCRELNRVTSMETHPAALARPGLVLRALRLRLMGRI